MTLLTKEAIDTLIAQGSRALPSIETADGGRAVLVPNGYALNKQPPIEPPLPRIIQAVALHEPASFIAYVNTFKAAHTALFAEPGFLSEDQGRVIALFDYHAPGTPDRLAHRATFKPRYSEQWTRWTSACDKLLKQTEFAEFIEEVRGDIVEPSAAQLFDIVRGFKASKKVEFDSLVYQPNGAVRLEYSEDVQQKGQSGILPEQLAIGIPVFYRGTSYRIPVFVRYKVDSGAVRFSLKIDRADIIEDTAFSEITAGIESGTSIKAYVGRV